MLPPITMTEGVQEVNHRGEHIPEVPAGLTQGLDGFEVPVGYEIKHVPPLFRRQSATPQGGGDCGS